MNSANRSFYETFQAKREDTENRLIYEIGNGQWDTPDLRRLLEEVLKKDAQFQDYVVEHDFPGIGRKKMLLNGRRIYQEGLEAETILLAIEDVTGK